MFYSRTIKRQLALISLMAMLLSFCSPALAASKHSILTFKGPVNSVAAEPVIEETIPDETVESVEESSPEAETAELADEPAPEAPAPVVEEAPKYRYISMEVPSSYSSNTGFKSYMSYKAITLKNSPEYRMQQEAVTDPATGIRKYDGCYMIAIGQYYAKTAGEYFRITLTNGSQLMCVTGDLKANRDTDAKNQHKHGNIVEFIVDTQAISRQCKRMGDMSYIGEAFTGRIASIEKVLPA